MEGGDQEEFESSGCDSKTHSDANMDCNKKIKVENIEIDQDFGPHQICENIVIKQEASSIDLISPKVENIEFINCSGRIADSKLDIDKYKSIYSLLFDNGILPNIGAGENLVVYRYYKFLFDIRFVVPNIKGYRPSYWTICKICNFSTSQTNVVEEIYNHGNVHIQKLGLDITNNIPIVNNYDYFVCTICHVRIMSQNDIQIHCQMHPEQRISKTIVDVKLVEINYDKTELLHFCKICIFASSEYLDIVKHLNSHAEEEANAVDNVKYNEDMTMERRIHSLNNHNEEIDNNICHNGGAIKWTGKPLVEVEVDHFGIYIPQGWQRKVFQKNQPMEGFERVIYQVAYVSPFGKLIFCRSNLLAHLEDLLMEGISLSVKVNKIDFSFLSHNLPKKKKSRVLDGRVPEIKREEVEVNNEDRYVPENWQRKLYKILDGRYKGKYYIQYISPDNCEIPSRSDMIKYLASKEKQGNPLSIDVEKLNFIIPSQYQRVDDMKFEVDIDNTGIYIPAGWQRKVYQYTAKSRNEGCRKVIYFSPNGRKFYNNYEVTEYIEQLEGNASKDSIELDKIDFKFGAQEPPKKSKKKESKVYFRNGQGYKKVYMSVDNTNIYVPEGWERKLRKRKLGKYEKKGSQKPFVCYISPCNKEFVSMGTLIKYQKSLVQKGSSLSVDIDKFNFSLPSDLCHTKIIDQAEEIEVDNTNIYVPEGWKRKIIKQTAGCYMGKCKIIYISPFNRKLFSRHAMIKYLETLEKKGCSLSVDLERLDFCLP